MLMCMMDYQHVRNPDRDTPILRQEPALDVVPPLKVMVTIIQQAATNSCLWQRRKLMNVIARTVVPHSAITDTLPPELDVACWFATCGFITGMCVALLATQLRCCRSSWTVSSARTSKHFQVWTFPAGS